MADRRRRERLQHVLRGWNAFERRLQGRPIQWVLTDFDGTLAPIRRHPDQAGLSGASRAALQRLMRDVGVSVAIVSGRSISQLRALVRLPGAVYIGNHGLEMSGPSVRFVHPGARRARPVLRRIAGQLRRALRDVPGSLVEDKGLSLSVHWRRVRPSDVEQFYRKLKNVLAPWVRRRAVRVARGKRVVEIRPPVVWHKGSAVEWLMKRSGSSKSLVIMFGDDRTDEDAFRAVNRCFGISVYVGRRPGGTAARWRLDGPREVRVTLQRLWGHGHGHTG
ncbi:MAG: trehalose-phosphatase [Candidatus Omnitrophica bacterium CG11_big_fil_rev_8_21_14_0_20_63_9]|nr:MAG: trehalose-phosphatase [Candidatus Omnitrophica bacterium CG11_big_fil_rev_8_21_14_0_20_63_9]